MFERYTEKARRVIFWARSEASEFGAHWIETEHVLLGLLKEDKALAQRFLGATSSESIRKIVESRVLRGSEVVPTSVDMPLSHECKRVLAYGAEEAERQHKQIETDHLLLGLLREEKSLAATILHEQGLRLAQVRKTIEGDAAAPPE
jgi:ATP-dependent Clp protease ATP-binding subunit ClpC